jgi:SagB-type dehydrogenase family enzyme
MKKTTFKLWEFYHENTKLSPHFIEKNGLSEEELYKFMLKNKKEFPLVKKIPLKSKMYVKVPVDKAFMRRRSIREFSPDNISFYNLSALLRLSYGISGVIYLDNKPYNLRTSPSAGGLYACTIYLVVIGVEKLKPGIYHFNSDKNELEFLLEDKKIKDKFRQCLISSSMFTNYKLALVVVADMGKIFYKYGERGYRYVLLDAGHIGENIYLSATALNLGVVGIEGFYDNRVAELLELDPHELPLYILLIGNKK